jgi:hypothetical protein
MCPRKMRLLAPLIHLGYRLRVATWIYTSGRFTCELPSSMLTFFQYKSFVVAVVVVVVVASAVIITMARGGRGESSGGGAGRK